MNDSLCHVDKSLIGIAGEFRVLSECLLRGYNASITFGNAKATDLIVFHPDNSYSRVEVKTSKNGRNFVTGFFPKYIDESRLHPDFWVFYLPRKIETSEPDYFYILTHDEVRELQLMMNKGSITEPGKGVDNITLKLLQERVEPNNWRKLG